LIEIKTHVSQEYQTKMKMSSLSPTPHPPGEMEKGQKNSDCLLPCWEKVRMRVKA